MDSLIVTKTSLESSAREVFEKYKNIKVWCFFGDLGAGKTAFIQQIVTNIGVEGLVKSPSFSIVNEYKLQEGSPIYHFDLYRVKDAEELFDIGIEEYLTSGCYCFIEWPEKVLSLLNDCYLKVEVSLIDSTRRKIIFKPYGQEKRTRVFF